MAGRSCKSVVNNEASRFECVSKMRECEFQMSDGGSGGVGGERQERGEGGWCVCVWAGGGGAKRG